MWKNKLYIGVNPLYRFTHTYRSCHFLQWDFFCVFPDYVYFFIISPAWDLVETCLLRKLLYIRHTGETLGPVSISKKTSFVRSRKVSKPREWYFKLSYRFEIWQAHRQQCCRSACQISERSDNSKYKSRGFETSRDLTKRRLFGYWDGALLITHHLQLEPIPPLGAYSSRSCVYGRPQQHCGSTTLSPME